ncbi:MAG: prepilin-type N-terminal cleavage/methylation domain-containing protein [Candidatus Pacebacteria bacterium]|nr:prepilin-type N-terminal cleavage/methylation domain-containing protein [Candidatus Paceibacterota bacterium]
MKNSPAQGFTLIELMVIAAIVGLLAGGAALAYFQFQNKVDVVATGQRFEQILKKAESMARTRVDKGKCAVGVEFLGYEVTVTNMVARIIQLCENGGIPAEDSINLSENGNVVRTPTTGLSYDFFTLQTKTPYDIDAYEQQVQFTTAGDDACYTVKINDLGVVSGEFSRPCP